MEVQPMAYWHDLSWSVRQRELNADGSITPGRIERLEDLAFTYELEKAEVKTKAIKEISYDIFDNPIVKKKKDGAKKVVTAKKQYVKATFKQQSITFTTTYKTALGTLDILGKIEEIREMIGYAAPLVLGREYWDTHGKLTAWPRVWGLFEMQLTKVQVGQTKLDELGRLLEATVKFTLTQTTDEAIIAATMTQPSDGTKLLLQAWVKDGYNYELVDPSTYTDETNPKKNKWFELIDGEYVKTKDKTVNQSKTYYQRSINQEVVPPQYWSAINVIPDPNMKALKKQKKQDKKRAKEEAKRALKEQKAAINAELNAQTQTGG